MAEYGPMLDLEVFHMTNSQVITLRLKSISNSLRINIRYSPSDSKLPEEMSSDFAAILRSATAYFMNT